MKKLKLIEKLAEITAVSLVMFVVVSVIAAAVTSTIQPPTKDAHVDEQNPEDEFGSETLLEVKGKTPGQAVKLKRTVVQFDLSSIPSGSIINSARLVMFLQDAPSQSTTHEVHRVTASWSESTINWNNQPTVASSLISSNTTGTTDEVFISWDVTANVQAFVSGTATNNGWRIRDINEAETGQGNLLAKYCSKESSTGSPSGCDSTKHPKLDIDYMPPLCELTATGAPAFGPMNPDATAGNGNKTTLENTGNQDITTLTIKGADWTRIGGGASMFVGQTRWALTDLQDYDNSMTNITSSDVSLGITPFNPSDTQDVFFKVRIPSDQAAGNYEQTITFTFEC